MDVEIANELCWAFALDLDACDCRICKRLSACEKGQRREKMRKEQEE